MAARNPVTEPQKARYVELVRLTGNKSLSARAIGFGPARIAKEREEDPEFAAAVREAEMEAADALEAEARRRAVEGVVREKWIGPADGGRFVEETQYSDQLLIRLMEANSPDKFASRSKTELSNPDGSLQPDLSETALAAKLASLLALAAQRKTASGDAEDLL